MSEKKELLVGEVVQAVGPVVDVRFDDKHLPALLTALEIQLNDGQKLTVEVMQHIGDDVVRTVAMGATEGVQRGNKVIDTQAPISVPVILFFPTFSIFAAYGWIHCRAAIME